MPHAACLQDWTHIRGSVNASVVQDAAAWFDLERYCSFWPMIDVRGFAGTPLLYLEFAPTAEEALFTTIDGPDSIAGVGDITKPSMYPIGAVGYQATPLFGGPPQAGGLNLPSRFMRWRVTSITASWALTFRIWLNLLPARTSRVVAARRAREAAAQRTTGSPAVQGDEFAMLRAAPVFQHAPPAGRMPTPSQSAAAYDVLARSLSRNHPSLDGVRSALARQNALLAPSRQTVASQVRSSFSRPPGGPPPGPPGGSTLQTEEIVNIHAFIHRALKAMDFPPVGAAWSVCQIWDGIPYEVGEGGAMGVKVIPRAPMVTTRGGPTFPPWRYDQVATPDERFQPETPIMVYSLSKTVTAVGVMKAVDRLIWSRAFVPLSADTTAYAAAAAAILRYPLIGSEIGSLIPHSLLAKSGAINPHAWRVAKQITIADLLAHLAGFKTNGIVPGASDWDAANPPSLVYDQLRADIANIRIPEIGTYFYTDDGYYLLRHVIAYLSWFVDGGSPGHGSAADNIDALLGLERQIGDKYRSFMDAHVFANCFSAFGKHYEPPFLKTRSDQSWCMPARPGSSDNHILWKPSFVEGRDPPVWALGGGSDWVFSARSYAWFLTCVRAGMVIPNALWNAMLDPSTLPTPPSSPPFSSKHAWGMKATVSSDPTHGSLVPAGLSALWWKPGDGNWGPAASPCGRVTDDLQVVNLGATGCEGQAIGTHSVWVLAGNTTICVVTNSECNPHDTGATANGRDYWQSRFFPMGAVVAVLNTFNWNPPLCFFLHQSRLVSINDRRRPGREWVRQ
jgi:hypothetical protein